MKNPMEKRKGLSGTFALNKDEPIHRWYKYDEGYSSELILNEFKRLPIEVKSIFEPFAGSGTTPLVAAQLGIESFFTEINPFMAFITESKINTVREAHNKQGEVLEVFDNLKVSILESQNQNNKNMIINYNGFEKYFDESILQKVTIIKKCIDTIIDPISKNLAKVALSAIAIKISKMVKRGDLRYAKENEKKVEDADVLVYYFNKLDEIESDIIGYSQSIQASTHFIHPDARLANISKDVDCVITSPPYLNGTNYIRNTKLELKLLEFIESEKDLPLLHSNGIMAGINSVSKRRTIPQVFDEVKPYVNRLEEVSYDKRIPIMVGGYFYDMNKVFQKLKKIIRNDGVFILDIGDSQFAGIHIPTDKLLSKIANKNGFELYEEETLRTRRSKNQMILTQKILRFRLKK
ncbi:MULTISPECIES: hypothetical protein [Bacillus]|uniref:hypothetical protein n=1 Tax=Bacillus TaxID=1386 RepID=UPI000617E214|nr:MULTISPECIES: hypothetical protein [Bacillus]KKB91064.1 hypothetical protein WB24_19750 [Bacillus sp. CMAA 1185]MBC9027128.1 hypothetical protein [Bacillus subtilis]MCH4864049.1 hypothetical protein [Bacillus sp. 1006-3]MCJ2150634.1 hypothetical protein [Bacillus subtilis]MCO8148737.1 hypothetical protein [Bacillus subtilis]